MTPDEKQRQLIREGVNLALRDFGFDADEWKEIRKDLAWTRRTRERCESISNRVAAWAVVALMGFASALSLEGLISRINKGGL